MLLIVKEKIGFNKEVVRLVEEAVLKTVGANTAQRFDSSCFRKRVWYNGYYKWFPTKV